MGQVKEMDDKTAHAKMSIIQEELKTKVGSVTILTGRQQSRAESTARNISKIS